MTWNVHPESGINMYGCFQINAVWWLKKQTCKEVVLCNCVGYESRAVSNWRSYSNVQPEQPRKKKRKKESGGVWRGVGGGKGLESDGRIHAGEINTRETRREKSGGAPQFTWRIWQFLCLLAIKSHASMFNSYYKGQGANITLGWSQVCGWNESSQMHCKSNS